MQNCSISESSGAFFQDFLKFLQRGIHPDSGSCKVDPQQSNVLIVTKKSLFKLKPAELTEMVAGKIQEFLKQLQLSDAQKQILKNNLSVNYEESIEMTKDRFGFMDYQATVKVVMTSAFLQHYQQFFQDLNNKWPSFHSSQSFDSRLQGLMIQLKSSPFWFDITEISEIAAVLQGCAPGTFIFRKSSSPEVLFSVSIKVSNDNIKHVRYNKDIFVEWHITRLTLDDLLLAVPIHMKDTYHIETKPLRKDNEGRTMYDQMALAHKTPYSTFH